VKQKEIFGMKVRTIKQLASMKRRAEMFVRNVLENSLRADEIASESIEEYAERKRIAIKNPLRKRQNPQPLDMERKADMATRAELEKELEEAYQRIEVLEEYVQQGQTLLQNESDDEDDEEDDDEE
jgi:hypothetical protein